MVINIKNFKYFKIIFDLIHQKINYLNKKLLIKIIDNSIGFNNKLKDQILNYYNPYQFGKFY